MRHFLPRAEALRTPTRLTLAVGCAAFASSAELHAQTTQNWSVALNLNEFYSSNPFLEDGGSKGSLVAEFGIAPNFVLSEPNATTSFEASYDRSQYLSINDHTDSYSAILTHNRRINERTNFNVNVLLNSSIPSESQFRVPTVATVSPVTSEPGAPTDVTQPATPAEGTPTTPEQSSAPPSLPTLDPSLIGSRQRQTLLSLSSGFSTGVGERGSLALDLHGNRSWAQGAGGDYRSYGETLSFSETLTPRSTLGASASVERTNYLDVNGRDSMFVEGQLTYSRQIGPLFHVSAEVGAVLIKNDGQSDRVTFSGSLSGCRTGEYDNLCLSLSRSAYPSVEGGVTTQFAGSMNYSYRLGPRDTLTASVSYSRSAGIADIFPATEYLTSGVTWSERISQRVSGGVQLAARGVTGGGRNADPDYSGRVFLSLTLGQLQ